MAAQNKPDGKLSCRIYSQRDAGALSEQFILPGKQQLVIMKLLKIIAGCMAIIAGLWFPFFGII